MTLTGDQVFKGFFVQARIVADDVTRVGSFAVGLGVADSGNSRLSSCVVNTVRLSCDSFSIPYMTDMYIYLSVIYYGIEKESTEGSCVYT